MLMPTHTVRKIDWLKADVLFEAGICYFDIAKTPLSEQLYRLALAQTRHLDNVLGSDAHI